jgi:hypothetical protein
VRRPRAATCCARRRSCRRGATCTASIPSACPAPLRCARACARRQPAGPPSGRRQRAARVRRAGALGHGQHEERGWTHRPGPGADRAQSRGSTATARLRRKADPLEELGRPRIDVVMTLSGIFRDLLPLQTRCLPRRPTWPRGGRAGWTELRAQAYPGLPGRPTAATFETAALRVFSNADGAYGSNVNLLVDNSGWDDEDELAETYTSRKCFAYGRDGKAAQQAELLGSMLGDVSSPTRTWTRSRSALPPSTSTSTPSAASAAP